ncbi:AMP-binding protein [Alcaligenaceae bacterium]|nr:AMP-binding protein [Alcaligenaceae bacterium]
MLFEYGLAGLLMRTALRVPQNPAVAYGTEVVANYEQLLARATSLSARFQALGVKPGSRVAILMKNHPAWLEIMFGCWHAGLAVVPINVKLHAKEVAHILQDCSPEFMFYDADNPAATEALASVPGTQGITIDTPSYQAWFTQPAAPAVAVQSSSLAWLFYTSGTTGRPKGAMLSHANLLAMALNYSADVEPEGVGRQLLHIAPMSHGSGLYMVPHVLHGSLQICPVSRSFDPHETEQLLTAYDKVSVFAAPTMITRLQASAKGKLPGLHTLVNGGAAMYVADTLRFIEQFGPRLAQIYGQGETPMTISAMPKTMHSVTHPQAMTRLASCGVAQTGMQVKVVDAQGHTLPPNEIGEIIVHGPTVMNGYWNLPEATAAALQNGWLQTGDLGSFDADGFLTLKARSKEVIISGGSNIYPREVEEILLLHPAVTEVSVVGHADADWGEVVVACIVANGDHEQLRAELEQLCLENIARFKRPKKYVFLDQLPKNATGKVLKGQLQAV